MLPGISVDGGDCVLFMTVGTNDGASLVVGAVAAIGDLVVVVGLSELDGETVPFDVVEFPVGDNVTFVGRVCTVCVDGLLVALAVDGDLVDVEGLRELAGEAVPFNIVEFPVGDNVVVGEVDIDGLLVVVLAEDGAIVDVVGLGELAGEAVPSDIVEPPDGLFVAFAADGDLVVVVGLEELVGETVPLTIVELPVGNNVELIGGVVDVDGLLVVALATDGDLVNVVGLSEFIVEFPVGNEVELVGGSDVTF